VEWDHRIMLHTAQVEDEVGVQPATMELAAQVEPFDSFWEAPEEIESGYTRFGEFYRHNYLRQVPADHNSRILVISCGAGYFVKLLREQGYLKVVGIDSFGSKVAHGRRHGLDCREARAFPFLATSGQVFDAIICEQELNHLTKHEMRVFLRLVYQRLSPGGTLIVHSLNGANPITGAEALAQNIDHFNTMTEYSLRQVLEHAGFEQIYVFPLNLYVFYKNPANYVAWGIATLLSVLFRACFMLYGKSNRIFTKKIGASCRKPA
jgi:SAM-dependent methyltransferase